MKRYLPVVAVVVVIAAVAGFLLTRSDNKSSEDAQTPSSSHEDMSSSDNASTDQSQSDQTQSSTESTGQITIANFAFSPSKTTIKAGTKVTWTNKDSAPHTITSDEGTMLNSDTLNNGDSFSFTFSQPGTYTYHCSIHPTMKATITVVQ